MSVYLFWRPIGYDLKKGKDLGISSHTRIGPTEIALLAAAGYKEVTVFKNTLNIGVLSIGDHLKDPTEPLVPGFMCDVNRITLISLLKEQGFHALDFGIVNNEWEDLKFTLIPNILTVYNPLFDCNVYNMLYNIF